MILEDHVDREPASSPPAIESVPQELLRQPLDFLFAEHFRHRQMCRIVEHLAETRDAETSLVARLDDFIRYDLALHVIDEEEDLFPLLRRRCEPDDDIDRVIGRLSGHHREDATLAQAVRRHLAQALATTRPVSTLPEAPADFRRFARQQRDHVALENGVVMPIARRRLCEADLVALARRLAARRGLHLDD